MPQWRSDRFGSRDQTLGMSASVVAIGFSSSTCLPAAERLHGHVGVQMIGPDDVDQIDAGSASNASRVRWTGMPGRSCARLPSGVVIAGQHAAQRKSRDAPDHARMDATPAAVPDQPDPHSFPHHS